MTHLLKQKPTRTPELNDQHREFLDALFSNGGNFAAAARVAGYSEGSVPYLKERLADHIIQRSKTILAGGAIKAANKMVDMIDAPEIQQGDNIRLQAAQTLLDRVGIGKHETKEVNVQAVHGVVLLPPKQTLVIDSDS